jgi:hypothetical protein
MAAPHIDKPMYRPLAGVSHDYLLPGIEFLENNGITLMEENRCFIEAHMVGLNHEMILELVWQHFPTDKRGTVFRYFWDPTPSPGEDPQPDIRDIHRWRSALCGNRASAKGANLVLVIKGDLIRRYPGTIIYAVKITKKQGGKWQYWSQAYPNDNPPMDENLVIEPVFRAQVGPDIQFAGFPFSLESVRGDSQDGEYYFVLQENQTLPRWGLDVQSTSQRRPERSSNPGNGLGWNQILDTDLRAGYINHFDPSLFGGSSGAVTSASVARATYQKPIRVVIHASHMLGSEQ